MRGSIQNSYLSILFHTTQPLISKASTLWDSLNFKLDKIRFYLNPQKKMCFFFYIFFIFRIINKKFVKTKNNYSKRDEIRDKYNFEIRKALDPFRKCYFLSRFDAVIVLDKHLSGPNQIERKRQK